MLRRWYILLPGIVGGGTDVYERVTGCEVVVAGWLGWAIFGGSLLVAAIGAYHDLRMSIPSGEDARRLLGALRTCHEEVRRWRVIVNRAQEQGHYTFRDHPLLTHGRAAYREGLSDDPARRDLYQALSTAYDSADDMNLGIQARVVGQYAGDSPSLVGDGAEGVFLAAVDAALDALSGEIEELESQESGQ